MPGFVDEAQVHVKAGDGGAGAVAFRREAHVAHGGPAGGDGGDGGDVVLEAASSVVSLLSFRDHPHRRATSGAHGSGANKHGHGGEELVVPVPLGTVVRTLEGQVLADLAEVGDRLVAASGGRGGKGNARFLSNRLRAPAFAEQAELGEERWLNLELKLLADVALVGFPNVGKSTLISVISAAKPKIADYPFTTLEPHLGVVRRASGRQSIEFTVADIPGLIEGASEGRGLGFQFLRHIERARVLLVLVDVSELAPLQPAAQVEVLLAELGRYRPELLDRPRLVVLSKCDLAPDLDPLVGASCDAEFAISGATGEGLDRLVYRLSDLVNEARATLPTRSTAPVLHRPEPEGFEVAREGAELVVLGREALRAVALSDLTDPDALAQAQRRMKTMGIDRALERAGARDGDTVRIGGLVFTFSSSH
jgi:GTP-binding protein